MVKVITPQGRHLGVPQALPQVLYIGSHAAELQSVLRLMDGLAIAVANSIEDGLTQVRLCRFDFVFFDQRDPAMASKHIAPLVQGFGYPVKLVVVSQLGSLGAYLKVPGLAAVLAAPMRPQHVLRVLGLTATSYLQSVA
ncbi:MAG: hypothetical protein ABI230_00800 [Aestuariivirga sp.]